MIKHYKVGGAVRDSFLGKKSKDLDYVVIAPSYQDMVNWISSQGEIFLEQPEYWTVRAHLKGKLPADYVLARKDGQYTDGRRPDSVSVGTLMDDLSRRDFTMNAIAIDEDTQEIIDPFNGQEDIKHGIIRCVGNPYDRFYEDALRLLRAIRFSITKGFIISQSIQDCLRNSALTNRLRDNVSDERKMEELYKCFACDTPKTLSVLEKYLSLSNAVFKSRKIWLMPTMKSV